MRFYKFAQDLVADPVLRSELEAYLLRSIEKERYPILSNLLTYGLPSVGLGVLSNVVLSRLLVPGLTNLISMGIPVAGISYGLLRGLHRAKELEQLRSDPFYRKMYLIRQLQSTPIAEQLSSLNLPLNLLLWRKALS